MSRGKVGKLSQGHPTPAVEITSSSRPWVLTRLPSMDNLEAAVDVVLDDLQTGDVRQSVTVNVEGLERLNRKIQIIQSLTAGLLGNRAFTDCPGNNPRS